MALIGLRLAVLVLAMSLSSASLNIVTHAQSANQEAEGDLTADAEVAVIRDVTQESDCILEVSDNGGSFKKHPCPPGTVIAVERTTSSQLSRVDRDSSVTLSGQRSADDQLIDRAVDEFRESIAPAAARQANCNERNRATRGSYNIGAPYRVEYVLKYEIKENCGVREIRDKARANEEASGNAEWVRSCSASSSQCKDRNAILRTGYTKGGRLPNSDIGRQYRNVSKNLDCMIFCVDYFGFFFFD